MSVNDQGLVIKNYAHGKYVTAMIYKNIEQFIEKVSRKILFYFLQEINPVLQSRKRSKMFKKVFTGGCISQHFTMI